MTKQNCIDDLQKIYNYLDKEKEKTNELLKVLENKEVDKLFIIDDFANSLDWKMSEDFRFALVTRLVNLRDDRLVQVLKKLEKSEEEIIDIQEKAYQFVKKYWHEKHKNLIDFIVQNNLLTPFYKEIFIGVYNVGLAMSSWQSSWTAHIINKINKEISAKFEGNEEKIMKYLEDEKLLDLGHGGIIADRCYSALVKENETYSSKAYIKAFKKEVTQGVDSLEEVVDKLIELEDEIYNQKSFKNIEWEYCLFWIISITVVLPKRCL